MQFRKPKFLSLFFVFILTAGFCSAEELPAAGTGSAEITTPTPVAVEDASGMQWAWGEVTAIELSAKTVSVKYLDPETDQENDLVLNVDDKTTFENAKGLEEIKLKDTLSIDYMIGDDDKNIAKNIVLEKPEEISAVSEQPKETIPAIIPPAPAEPVAQSQGLTLEQSGAEGAPAAPEAVVPIAPEPAMVEQSSAQETPAENLSAPEAPSTNQAIVPPAETQVQNSGPQATGQVQ